MKPTNPHPPAFTLIEVLLATSLTVVVMGLIYMAIDFHLRALNSCRSGVEEALLTRAVLHRIADDIRCAVPNDPLQSEQTMVLPGVSASDLQNELLAVDPNLQFDPVTPDDTTDDSASSADTLVPNPVPGLFGEIDWIQIDVSRLPRLDQIMYGEFDASDTGQVQLDRLSDLKSVKYYVIPPAADGSTGAASGLVRLERDRATTIFEYQNGGVDQSNLNVTPIVPEVQAIEFSYFDGQEWLDYWDSQEMGGLPWAVSITLAIIPPTARPAAAQTSQSPGQVAPLVDASQWTPIYRSLTVYLPAARAALAEGVDVTTPDPNDPPPPSP